MTEFGPKMLIKMIENDRSQIAAINSMVDHIQRLLINLEFLEEWEEVTVPSHSFAHDVVLQNKIATKRFELTNYFNTVEMRVIVIAELKRQMLAQLNDAHRRLNELKNKLAMVNPEGNGDSPDTTS